MLKHWRRPVVAVSVVLFLIAVPAVLLANHSWSTYHWSMSGSEVSLLVGDNVSNTWDPYLNEAIDDWNPSSVIQLAKTTGGTRPKTCKPTAGRIEACSERYGFTGWLGIAQIWVSGGHISQAITKVNDSYFNTATYNKPAWRRMVMCQEIAHDFGLSHQDETFDNTNKGSCMDYTDDPDGTIKGQLSNEHPNAHDFDQLEAIYNHTHSSAGTGGGGPGNGNGKGNNAPPAFNDLIPEGPGQWGRLIRQSRDGGISVYELDFGGGNRIITVVTWTIEEAAKRARHD